MRTTHDPLISGQRCGSCVVRTLLKRSTTTATYLPSLGQPRPLSPPLSCRSLSTLPALSAFLVRSLPFSFSHLRPHPRSTPRFSGPFTRNVNRTLTISNYNALPVAFKVKTTAPNVCSGSLLPDSRILTDFVRSLAVRRKTEFR